MADPYWDTIDDGSQVIGSYDITKGERSPIDAFQIEVDRKAKELQDLLDLRDMAKAEAEKAMSYTGRNPIEQAIVGLAPMALGAILGGKQGLGAGGIGAVAGLKAYDSYADEEAKRQQLIASQFYKDAQANVTASQKAMDALRGKQTEMSVDHQNDLEIAMFNNEAKKQIAGMKDGNPLDEPASPAVIALAQAVFPEGVPPGVTNRELTQVAGLKRTEQLALNNKLKQDEDRKEQIESLEDRRIGGLRLSKLPLNNKQHAELQDRQGKYSTLLLEYQQLRDIYKAAGGQPLSGALLEGAKTKTASLMLKLKELNELGAAFTELEAMLAKYSGGLSGLSEEEAYTQMGRDVLFNSNPELRAKFGQEALEQDAAVWFAGRGAGIEWINYSKLKPEAQERIQQQGIQWDPETGKLAFDDVIDRRIAQLRSGGTSAMTSNREGMGQTQQQQKKPLKEFLQENGINYKALDEKAQVRALADMKRAGYKDDEIAKVLGGNNANP